jgi:hypothetical protein
LVHFLDLLLSKRIQHLHQIFWVVVHHPMLLGFTPVLSSIFFNSSFFLRDSTTDQ